jgi:hypothetical protein
MGLGDGQESLTCCRQQHSNTHCLLSASSLNKQGFVLLALHLVLCMLILSHVLSRNPG